MRTSGQILTPGGAAMLRVIDIHGNRIKTIPKSIGSLRGLEELSAQGNELSALPDEMCEMRRLRRLNVAENNLTALPDKLGDAMMLTTLWCYNNPDLTSLPESLVKNLSLRAVWAEGCGLEPDALAGMVNAMAAPGGPRKNGAATLGLDAGQAVAAGLKLRSTQPGEEDSAGGAIVCDHAFVAISEMGSGIPGSSSNGSESSSSSSIGGDGASDREPNAVLSRAPAVNPSSRIKK